MNQNNYKVYIHICPNNKKYIGITCNIKQRWGKNGYGYRKNVLFSRAIKKYGWNNIEHKILFENLTEKEAQLKEIELISKYKSSNSKYGYNISIGGDKTTTGYKFTTKQKENLSKAKFYPIYCIEDDKYYYSKKELKENNILGCYKAASGKRNTYLGKHYIFIKYINKKDLEKLVLKRNSKKKVICLETKKIYNSIMNASIETGCRSSCISECCSNKLKSTKKLHWQYYTDEFNMLECDNIIKKKKITNDKRIKKVKCIDTGKIYESCYKAYLETKIYHISECCNDVRKTAGGYKWVYINEGECEI